MKTIHDLSSSQINRPTVLTWGVFDGLHIGHQKIIRMVVERAQALQVAPTVITFEPHPLRLLRPELAPPPLQPFDQRIEGLAMLGIKQTIVVRYTSQFARTTAEHFVRETVFGQLDAREVYLEEGVTFGHNHQDGFDLVLQIAQELGRVAVPVAEVRIRGCRVQATTIRQFLKAGHVNLVRKMLGRAYEIESTVIEGSGLGQKRYFGMVHLQVDNDLIPVPGVYLTQTLIGDNWQPSMTNICIRSGFGNDSVVSVECYLVNAQQDLPGQRLRLRFLDRLQSDDQFSRIDDPAPPYPVPAP